jgi:SAM-dependent methyltransferase
VPPQPIDVQALIRTLSDEDLLAAADAYFTGLTPDSEQCHKPFSNPDDAVHLHRNLALLLQAADLFRGADVLDLGCATGWLTLSLADLGCHVIGADISPQAIALARQVQAGRATRPGGSARFVAYDGRRLPLEDGSLDRVVCFDAFHHVRDPAATLAELARVLRPGGRIAMVEPGPNHSRTPQSQAEMALYNVIENDVDMAQVAAAARVAGLGEPELLVQLPAPLVVPLEQYLAWAASPALPEGDDRWVLSHLLGALTNTQCFSLTKAGSAVADSRQAHALAARLGIVASEPIADGSGDIELTVQVANTGEAVWILAEGVAGEVKLGVQLLGADGSLQQRDFMRVPLHPAQAHPGGEQLVTFRVRRAESRAPHLRLDLVAEQVAWFSQMGRTEPVDWPGPLRIAPGSIG